MSVPQSRLAHGTLWPRLLERTHLALTNGDLQPIQTVEELIEDHGVRFLVRRVSSIARKEQARRAQRPGENPFLPYEEPMFVADVLDSHVALLNKYNVLEHHLLIVTRAFEDQEAPLTVADFHALWLCLGEIDGLGFYNGGRGAGASQRHKHLQLVPLPLSASGPAVPIEPLLPPTPIGRITGAALPCRHAYVTLDPLLANDPAEAAAVTAALYQEMAAVCGVEWNAGNLSRPYNLLVTHRWMLLVPRCRERVDSVSVNALGYAGSFFVRDETQMQALRAIGPTRALQEAGLPCPLLENR